MAKHPCDRPGWTESIGRLIDEGIEIRASCSKCREWKVVDLVALAVIKGRDFDLWNRRPRCTITPGCPGRAMFLYSGRGVFRNMRD